MIQKYKVTKKKINKHIHKTKINKHIHKTKINHIHKSNKSNKSKIYKKCISFEKLLKEKHYNSNYLKNPICKFIPLFDFNPNIKKNIVSACFFKMRKGSYKNFNKYLNGINILYDVINEQLPNFTLRLFIDMSIYNDENIMKMLNKLEKIEIVLYCCEFYERNDVYHLGTFGTILRSFPLCDFPNNDSERVIIVDIDVIESNKYNVLQSYIELIKNYSDKELNSLYLFGSGNPYMVLNDKKYIIDNKYIKPYIIIDRIIGFKKIPNKLIINFLYNLKKTKQIFSTYYISKIDKLKKCDEYICFGIDEYLINDIIIPYLLRKKYSLLFLVICNIQSTIFYFNKEVYINLKNKYYSYINFLIKNIDPKLFKSNNIKELIDFINNIFYKDNNVILQSELNEVHKLILKNYYDLFYDVYTKKDFSIFNKDTLDIILSKDMIGYLKKVKYINYNNNLKSYILNDKSVKIDMSPEQINYYHNIVDSNRKNIIF